jgi:predicted nucleic acid-binding protein
MIIVDTNVVLEAISARPDPAVIAWLDRQYQFDLYLTATSLSEILLGIYILPEGRKKRTLYKDITETFEQIFGTRVLSFDSLAAEAYARVVSQGGSIGRVIKHADGQIAAIASVHGFAVATRDTKPFLAAGIQVINPWTD